MRFVFPDPHIKWCYGILIVMQFSTVKKEAWESVKIDGDTKHTHVQKHTLGYPWFKGYNMAARQTVNSRRTKGKAGGGRRETGFGWREVRGGRRGALFFFFFCHKGRGEEMMWEKQTGSLAGLPNVWKGPHWVNKALTGEELTTTRHHTHTHAHTHRGVERTRVSLIIWVRSFNPGWVEWRGLCACVC